MTTLTDFLLARLAEDEAIAEAAVDDDTHWLHVGNGEFVQYDGRVSSGWLVLNHRFEAADHIARHDPARVLAEVEAKRRIVTNAQRHAPGQRGYGAANYPVQCLALAYADHPDYRDEWRP